MAFWVPILTILTAGLLSIKVAVILIAVSTVWNIAIKDCAVIAQTMIIWLIICLFSFIKGYGALALWGTILGILFYGLLYLNLEGKQKPRI